LSPGFTRGYSRPPLSGRVLVFAIASVKSCGSPGTSQNHPWQILGYAWRGIRGNLYQDEGLFYKVNFRDVALLRFFICDCLSTVKIFLVASMMEFMNTDEKGM
jgi:hypothetical protein